MGGIFILKKCVLFICLYLVFMFTGFCDEVSGLKFIMRHNPITATISDSHTHSPSFEFFTSETSEVKLFFLCVLKFYQLFISSQDRPACMFTPTCSEYARLAIEKYGLLAGTVMAAERLLRCNGTGRKYYRIDDKTGRLYDPVE